VEDLPHGGLKTWKLSGKLGMLFGGSAKFSSFSLTK
jgi:hypothetical protein